MMGIDWLYFYTKVSKRLIDCKDHNARNIICNTFTGNYSLSFYKATQALLHVQQKKVTDRQNTEGYKMSFVT